LRTNIYSFLMQMDHVPLWCVLHGVWWKNVHINHRTVHLLVLHEYFIITHGMNNALVVN
jgi:hypothetical protein